MKRLPRERREQYGRDRDRIKFGTQGAASEVRKIDVASVDTAALMEQLLRQPPPASPAKQGFIASKKRFFLQKGKAINNDDIQVWYRQLFNAENNFDLSAPHCQKPHREFGLIDRRNVTLASKERRECR
jgi:hypothetical protein